MRFLLRGHDLQRGDPHQRHQRGVCRAAGAQDGRGQPGRAQPGAAGGAGDNGDNGDILTQHPHTEPLGQSPGQEPPGSPRRSRCCPLITANLPNNGESIQGRILSSLDVFVGILPRQY